MISLYLDKMTRQSVHKILFQCTGGFAFADSHVDITWWDSDNGAERVPITSEEIWRVLTAGREFGTVFHILVQGPERAKKLCLVLESLPDADSWVLECRPGSGEWRDVLAWVQRMHRSCEDEVSAALEEGVQIRIGLEGEDEDAELGAVSRAVVKTSGELVDVVSQWAREYFGRQGR